MFSSAIFESSFTQNRLTSRQLVNFYLDRIQALNPSLRCVLEVNPDALDQADEADQLRAEAGGNGTLGGLHGIPVLLKDSIGTDDKMNTSAGSYVLLGAHVVRDAFVVERLRSTGVVILGKASMSEWYSLRSSKLSSSWCARGGQCLGHTDVRHLVDECTCNCDMCVIESDSHRTGDMANANAAGGAPSPMWSKPAGKEAGGGLLGSGAWPVLSAPAPSSSRSSPESPAPRA